jgi:hypothetical protein
LLDFIVGRICDQLGIPNRLIDRWGSQETPLEVDDQTAAARASESMVIPEADA